MIVLIDGHPASGKSLFRAMLDGHPDVFASPFHDIMPLAFCTKAMDTAAMEAKDTEWLRKVVSERSRYYRIERMANNGKIQLDVSSDERRYVDIDLDFYQLDRTWMQGLLEQKGGWNPEIIVEKMYHTMRSTLRTPALSSDINPSVILTLGDGKIDAPRRFLERFPSGKVIYVKRNLNGIVGALSSREPIPEDYRTHHHKKDDLFDRIMKSNFVSSVVAKERELADLSVKYPARVHIDAFETFFSDREAVKSTILDFLRLPDHEITNNFTLCGHEVRLSNGDDIFHAQLDNPAQLLSSFERRLLRMRASSGLSSLINSVKDPLAFIYVAFYKTRRLLGLPIRIIRRVFARKD